MVNSQLDPGLTVAERSLSNGRDAIVWIARLELLPIDGVKFRQQGPAAYDLY
jgi:hypothetical protein